MKIVIDLPKEKFEWIKKNNPNADPNSIVGAVANGTPLYLIVDCKIDQITDLLETEWGYVGIREDVARIMGGIS